MLDVRVYRAAFLPALLALFVTAFSLGDRPAPAVSQQEAKAFDGPRAAQVLHDLGEEFPSRAPGSADDHALADRIAKTLAAPDRMSGPGFRVTRERVGDVETVVAMRPGLSSRRIVVLSHRDAVGKPGLAELSGTAAMLELGRLFRGRELRKTLVLVSTSGATAGFTGARAWAEGAAGGSVDAVLVLGDLAGVHMAKPWVVPWTLDGTPAPLELQRTVENAVRAEVRAKPGGSRAAGQWIRRALPVTVSEQGVVGATGLPAVMLGVSGERGPAADEPVRDARLAAFGRAAMRAVLAMNEAGPSTEQRAQATPAFSQGPDGIVTMRNVLPDWSVRLLVGTLLLPALLTALDGFFRVRRRRLAVGPWLGWLFAIGLPLVLVWLWLRLLGIAGALDPPEAPVLPPPAVETAGFVVIGSGVLVLALGWFGIRPLILARVGERGNPAAGSLAAASGAVLCSLAAIVWVFNTYAAALLLPAAHLWLFAGAPQTRMRGWAGVAAIVVGLLPLAFAVFYYGRALGLDPLELAWTAVLGAVSGEISLGLAISTAALLSSLAGLVLVMRTRRRAKAQLPPEPPLRTRGPATYAGPGSLGGTESALRR